MNNNVFLQGMREATEKWKQEAEKWLYKRAKEIIEEESEKFDTLIEIQNYMMDKQAQDERWKALTEDGRQARIAGYQELLKLPREEANRCLITIEDLEELYGKHNLNPEPQIKEWKDVPLRGEICDVKMGEDYFEIALLKSEFYEKLFLKIIATARISKIIELSYGGMVTEEEWKKSASYNIEDALWTIVCECKKEYQEPQFRIACNWEQVDFLSFHSKELAEKFMSHESNRQLVKQYFMM